MLQYVHYNICHAPRSPASASAVDACAEPIFLLLHLASLIPLACSRHLAIFFMLRTKRIFNTSVRFFLHDQRASCPIIRLRRHRNRPHLRRPSAMPPHSASPSNTRNCHSCCSHKNNRRWQCRKSASQSTGTFELPVSAEAAGECTVGAGRRSSPQGAFQRFPSSSPHVLLGGRYGSHSGWKLWHEILPLSCLFSLRSALFEFARAIDRAVVYSVCHISRRLTVEMAEQRGRSTATQLVEGRPLLFLKEQGAALGKAGN